MWESVVHANAADPRGTHATKTRAFVSGTGKKPWKQKGTGRAQVGSSRTPLWRHGGTVHPPRPRSYDFKLSKKVERGALRAALSEKMKAGDVIVVDALAATEVKTKTAVEMPKRLGITGNAVLRMLATTRSCRVPGAYHPGVSLVQSARPLARDVLGPAAGGDARRAREAAGVRCMKPTTALSASPTDHRENIKVLRTAGRSGNEGQARTRSRSAGDRAVARAKVQHPDQHPRQDQAAASPAGRRSDWKKAVKLREGAKMPNSGRRVTARISYHCNRRRPAHAGRQLIFDEITTSVQPAARAAAQHRRPQQRRAPHLVVARRRPQADVPDHRLQAEQVRHSGEGRDDRA